MPSTTAQKYFGQWTDRDSVILDFLTYDQKHWNGEKRLYEYTEAALDFVKTFPTHKEIRFAGYVYEDYSGNAIVVFVRDGKLYEAHASHCSCYGLAEPDGHGFHPEETSKEALAMRPETGFGEEADLRWRSLFGKTKRS